MRKLSKKKQEILKRQKQQEANEKNIAKNKRLGLVQMPRCWIPAKDVEFFRGLARIVKNEYLRKK